MFRRSQHSPNQCSNSQMASQIPNTFTSYKLNEEETFQGSILSAAQQYVLQNMLTGIAEQVLNLVFEHQDPIEFAKQHAFLSGQMSILRVLLLTSEDNLNRLKATS